MTRAQSSAVRCLYWKWDRDATRKTVTIRIDREDTDRLSRSELGLRFERQLPDIPEKAPRPAPARNINLNRRDIERIFIKPDLDTLYSNQYIEKRIIKLCFADNNIIGNILINTINCLLV